MAEDLHMIISHNIPGLNALNKLKVNDKQVSKSIEKLSSGLRITRAAYDASGLSISEKLRAQIRGLSHAERNIQDGISLIQTAEGAMAESHNMLQRIRELSVQASNDSYIDQDRTYMQDEINQLIDGLDKIATQTEFNTKVLLAGRFNKDKNEIASNSIADHVQSITKTGGVTDKYTYSDGSKYASAIIDFSNINSADDIEKLIGKGVNYTCCTCNKAYSIKFVDGNPNTSRLNDYNPVMEVDVSSITSGEDLVKKIIETAYGDSTFVYNPSSPNPLPSGATSFVDHFSKLAADGAKLYIYDDRSNLANSNWPQGDQGRFDLNVYGEDDREDLFLFLKLQTGSQAGQNITLKIPNLTMEQLRIDKVSVLTRNNANASISMVDAAINRVSRARSTLGAYQNRLEHTYRNVSNSRENLSSAESRIRDADMAKEMMVLTKHNILAQSTQVMLLHTYNDPQKILQLLR